MTEKETGWLLEKMHEGNVHYISADYVLQWTDDPNKALRLSRREDAEALCTIVEDCEKIAGHEWPGDSPSDAEQLSELRRATQASLDLLTNVYHSHVSQRFSAVRLSPICTHIRELQTLLNPKKSEKEAQRDRCPHGIYRHLVKCALCDSHSRE